MPQHQAATALAIDDAASQITIIVRRGGLLARLGHDHLVLVKNLQGSVDPRSQRARLQFRLDEMEVDPAALRLAAGLQPQPSAEAIAGTRRNMLTRTLDAEHYPLVQLQAERQGEELALQITLHGVTRKLRVPATIISDGHKVQAEGSFTILQSDYGITPFAVMGGALAVQDQLELHYHLLAHE
ncbi:YceI family protein [Pseudoduganella sp. CY13W]|uniref:YceI family protein n=2 Tax=Duganella qianjiadongensis TaxID=2692176 RepID=A0ABW9VI54_9BURK|nr:YceI family protein [Duganella qianjiadongensis]